MKKYNIEVEIDEDGNIQAETKGFKGNICEKELSEILAGIKGQRKDKKKPEYFAKEASNLTQSKMANKL